MPRAASDQIALFGRRSFWPEPKASPDSPICAATGANDQDVNDLLLRSPTENDAPLANSQSPEALRSAEALDVTIGELADR